ncbi:polysaccharide biosynthesis tyrosine autokinase [Mycobacterium frederiksbergense]|uniref:BY-kinase domain-containing protein n=1 Tax=Mycolicibacterium frederiksbergense TaxID=117567 RepID=UPI0021F2621C|nr:polysaccharide biosynthesis tyrosine autokinase [Mycolicibacterium frederiksbergense]MCV7047097.1 polysaccharide biosynthesis tyrosine autokinase [Mycolicibacterium frederiksbergense]
MTLQDYLKVLRSRWVTIGVTIVATVAAAAAVSLLTTPLYQASTRLFVSTTAGASLADTYQGNRYSQERVVSYAELLQGQTLAQRTIDKLSLNMSASELQQNIKASVRPDTVLISVDVLDESPVQARDIANTMSDEFVSMIRELETPEGGTTPDSRVVVEQRATIVDDPVVPKTQRNIAIGLVLGVLLGLALAIVRDLLDNTIKGRETVEGITSSGLVGQIPLDKDRRAEPAISFDIDNSAIAEAFRKLRTNLQFLAVDDPPRIILLTSSVPSEGKSTTSINLALALSESEHNVVLVDGDLRRPTLHRYLDLVGTVGFSTVLSGQASLEDALQKTRFPGLTVLASGAIPPNPSELLASQSARRVINDLRDRFDYVIIDSTPLLAVTDAAILATAVDGVLMIARFGHTKRDQLTQAISALENVSARLLGVVLTMTPTRGSSYHNYSYYGPDADRANHSSIKRRPS